MGEQTGLTTRQLIEAPVGAMYIWKSEILGYIKALAARHHRLDLFIVGPSVLRFGLHGTRGFFKSIVLDHATELSDKERAIVTAHNEKVKEGICTSSTLSFDGPDSTTYI